MTSPKKDQPTTAGSMSTKLITISHGRSVAEARQLMEERRIRHLPVTDNEGFVIGILSDRDLVRGHGLVKDCMSWPAITVGQETPVADLVEGMIDEKVSAFLVTGENSEVVGIVTSEDLLKLLPPLLREEKASLAYHPVVREVIQELQAAGI